MTRHDRACQGLTTTAISHCRFSFLGRCTDHLVASFHGDTVPQHDCDHHPEQALAAQPREAARPVPVHGAA